MRIEDFLKESLNIGIIEAFKRSRILVHKFGWWKLFILFIIIFVMTIPSFFPLGFIIQSFISPLIICIPPCVYKYITSRTSYKLIQ